VTIPVHRSAEIAPTDRGHAFGVARRDAVANTVAVYRRLLAETAGLSGADIRSAGRRVGAQLDRRWPDLVGELEGIAAGARVPVDLLLAVNARTELLGGAGGECSLVASVEDGRCVVAQNWDWHPDLGPSLVAWVVSQQAGRWFTTVTEAGMLAKLGLSSAGICCGLNFLRTSLDGGVDGVPIHVLLRVLLDRIDTFADALELIRSAPVSGSSCITLGSTELVAAELSPAGCRLVRPDADGRLTHTNHFVAGPPAGDDLEAAEAPSTLIRLSLLAYGQDALRSHANAPESICRHASPRDRWADRRATLASLLMEPGTPRLRVAAGPPCRHALADVTLPLADARAAR
jgi:isopenicillin-N N-acyltransferase like protein